MVCLSMDGLFVKTNCERVNDQCSSHKETSQLIFRANQLAGFYMRQTLVADVLYFPESLQINFVDRPSRLNQKSRD